MESCDFGEIGKDAVAVIAVNPAEHKRATRASFGLKKFLMELW